MPHRVVNFIRSSTDNISSINSRVARARTSRDLERSYANSISDESECNSLKMVDTGESASQKKHHRLSFSFGRSGKGVHDLTGASLDWKIESPPIVFYGNAENSTGALVSGQLFLTVREDMLEVESFEASLNIRITQKRPFHNHCHECSNQYTELKRWTFLSHPTTLNRGNHQYPFSILLGGHLPASMDTPLVSISYEFKAEAHVFRQPTSSNSSVGPIKFERILDVKRALEESDQPHHSLRVFPPTNVKAGAHYTQVIHPTSSNTLSMRLDGLTNPKGENKTMEFWKLKKVTWRLEETIKTIAPACAKHTPSDAGGRKKGVERTDTRVLGEKAIGGGWKGDYLSGDGYLEFDIDFAIVRQRHHQELRYACDSKSQDGTEVSHTLMVELVVSRELAPLAKPQLATATGTGRILRMHYHVVLTEMAGLGVSWDEESPPVYGEVPPSPPAYPKLEPIDYESLEMLDAARSSEESQPRMTEEH